MSAPVCAPCQDSALSITGNVIGIVTLVYVLAVGVFWRISVVKKALKELEIMHIDFMYVEDAARALMERAPKGLEGESQKRVTISSGMLARQIETLQSVRQNLIAQKWKETALLTGLLLSVRCLMARDQMKEAVERTNVWSERLRIVIEDAR